MDAALLTRGPRRGRAAWPQAAPGATGDQGPLVRARRQGQSRSSQEEGGGIAGGVGGGTSCVSGLEEAGGRYLPC